MNRGVFIQVGGLDTVKKREGGIWDGVRAIGRGTKRVEEVCRQMAYLEFWQLAWFLVQQCVLPVFLPVVLADVACTSARDVYLS